MIGQNLPATPSGGNVYNRNVNYDAPVLYDAGLYAFPENKTLAELRRAVVIRLGFFAPALPAAGGFPAASAYPPGMAALVDSFLGTSNRTLHLRYPRLRTARWFSLETVVGARNYDIPIDGNDYLDTRRIVGAFVTDTLGRSAWPLNYGLTPGLCNQEQTGRPWCFEIRGTIEVWPIPDAVYLLRFQGDSGLRPFAADADTASVDTDLLLLHALARAKKHYGQPDADAVNADADEMMRKLAAGAHVTARYIPGTAPVAPLARPLIKGIDVP